LKSSLGRGWLAGCSENNTLRDIGKFLAENIHAFAINWMLKHAVSRLKSSNIGGGIDMDVSPTVNIGRHVPPCSIGIDATDQ